MQTIFGYASGALVVLASLTYLRSILKGQAKPDRGANIIWAGTSTVSFFAYWAGGAEESVWFAAGDFVVALGALYLALKYGYGWVKGRHIPGLVVALIGLILWALTDDPLIALLCSVGVDAVGSTLVVIKSYEAPHTEHMGSWLIYLLAAVVALITIDNLNFTQLLYPSYAVLAAGSIIVAMWLGQIQHNRKKSAEV